MDTSYDVRIHKTDIYRGANTTTYWVRWKVAGHPYKEPFKHSGLARSFRSSLVQAASKGEAFTLDTGLPVSMKRPNRDVSWYSFACDYVDMKWKPASANYRRSIAEAMTTVTTAMLATERGKPDDAVLRRALFRWAFNKLRREKEAPPDIAEALRWASRSTRPVSDLAKAEVIRRALDMVAAKLDGTRAAATVVARKRAVLSNAIGYAIEKDLLDSNPIGEIKWRAPKANHTVDRRTVVNPIQARTLLRELGEQRPSGPRLKAFFGLLYYAALRPEEAVNLRPANLKLPPATWDADSEEWNEPEDNWGEIYLDEANPDAGAEWTDSGTARERRQLKHRAVGEGRTVPCTPELTRLLRDHLRRFGTGPDGRLFTGVRGGELARSTYDRAWRTARREAFSPEVAASRLGKTPYSLRHACVSTWLNGGVDPTQVADWAGHSVKVLLETYAACLDRQDLVARQRAEAALGGGPHPGGPVPT